MGMRANEIVNRVVRDLDDGGKLLWIPDSKTEAGRRTLQVPELLQPHLLGLPKGSLPRPSSSAITGGTGSGNGSSGSAWPQGCRT